MEGVCRINSKQLSSKLTFELSSREDCDFWLSAYLNDVVSLSLDKQYRINHKSSTMAVYEFDFQVPAKSFDELSTILQFKEGQGAEMFANVGNTGALQPD